MSGGYIRTLGYLSFSLILQTPGGRIRSTWLPGGYLALTRAHSLL